MECVVGWCRVDVVVVVAVDAARVFVWLRCALVYIWDKVLPTQEVLDDHVPSEMTLWRRARATAYYIVLERLYDQAFIYYQGPPTIRPNARQVHKDKNDWLQSDIPYIPVWPRLWRSSSSSHLTRFMVVSLYVFDVPVVVLLRAICCAWHTCENTPKNKLGSVGAWYYVTGRAHTCRKLYVRSASHSAFLDELRRRAIR